jgi:hypothetical protein
MMHRTNFANVRDEPRQSCSGRLYSAWRLLFWDGPNQHGGSEEQTPMDDGPDLAIFLARMRRLVIKGAALLFVIIGTIICLYFWNHNHRF